MKKTTEGETSVVFLFLSFDQPNTDANRNRSKDNQLPRESSGYKYRGGSVSTADDADAHRFLHGLRWDPS